MAAFQVTSGELKSKAEALRGLNGQFKSQVGNLEAQEARLAGMWEGEAQKSFRQAFNRDKGQMDNFYKAIEDCCQKLEMIAAKYEQAESQNVSTASTRTY